MDNRAGKRKREGVEINTLGTLAKGPWEKKYWSASRGKDRYPYPVGYQAACCYGGHNYSMEIREGKRGPLFLVTCEEGITCSGETPAFAWESILKRKHVGAKKMLGWQSTTRINGSEMFGLTDPVVQLLLRELVAAEKGGANASSSSYKGVGGCAKTSVLKQATTSSQLLRGDVEGCLVDPAVCTASEGLVVGNQHILPPETSTVLDRDVFANNDAKEERDQQANIIDAVLGLGKYSEHSADENVEVMQSSDSASPKTEPLQMDETLLSPSVMKSDNFGNGQDLSTAELFEEEVTDSEDREHKEPLSPTTLREISSSGLCGSRQMEPPNLLLQDKIEPAKFSAVLIDNIGENLNVKGRLESSMAQAMSDKEAKNEMDHQRNIHSEVGFAKRLGQGAVQNLPSPLLHSFVPSLGKMDEPSLGGGVISLFATVKQDALQNAIGPLTNAVSKDKQLHSEDCDSKQQLVANLQENNSLQLHSCKQTDDPKSILQDGFESISFCADVCNRSAEQLAFESKSRVLSVCVVVNEEASDEVHQDNVLGSNLRSHKSSEQEPAYKDQISSLQLVPLSLVDSLLPAVGILPLSPGIKLNSSHNEHNPPTSGLLKKELAPSANYGSQQHFSDKLNTENYPRQVAGFESCLQVDSPSVLQQNPENAASVMTEDFSEDLIVEGRLNKLGVATVLSPSYDMDLSSDTLPDVRDTFEGSNDINGLVEQNSLIISLENQSQRTDSESLGQELTSSMVAILLPQALPLLKKKSARKKKIIRLAVQEMSTDPKITAVAFPVSRSTSDEKLTDAEVDTGKPLIVGTNLNHNALLNERSEQRTLAFQHTVEGVVEKHLKSLVDNPDTTTYVTNCSIDSDSTLVLSAGRIQNLTGLPICDEFVGSRTKQIQSPTNNYESGKLSFSSDVDFWIENDDLICEDTYSFCTKNFANHSLMQDSLAERLGTELAFQKNGAGNRSDVPTFGCIRDNLNYSQRQVIANEKRIGDVLDFEGLPSFPQELVQSHCIEPVVCLEHPLPVIAMCMNVRGHYIRVCVCCGVSSQQERILFIYEISETEESQTALLAAVNISIDDGFGHLGMSNCSIEECGIRFSPDGQGLILVGCFQVHDRRNDDEVSQGLKPSSHVRATHMVNFFSFSAQKVKLEASLETEQELHCLSVPSAQTLVAAGEQSYVCFWEMDSFWRSFQQKFRLPTVLCTGITIGSISRLLAVPGLPDIVLGCDVNGSFAVWDLKSRLLLSVFLSKEYSFPKAHALDNSLLAWCKEHSTSEFGRTEKMKNMQVSEENILDVLGHTCEKLNGQTHEEKDEIDAFEKHSSRFAPIPCFFLVVMADVQEAIKKERGSSKGCCNQETCCLLNIGSWKIAALTKETVMMRFNLDDQASVATVMGRYGVFGITNGKVYLWDIPSGKRIVELLELEGSVISCMAAHQASGSLAIAGKDGRVILYICMPNAGKRC